MIDIAFILFPKNTEGPRSYQIRYEPTREMPSQKGTKGGIYVSPSTSSKDLDPLLMEAILGIRELNPDRHNVTISLYGNLSKMERDKVKTFFDTYANADKVKIKYNYLRSPPLNRIDPRVQAALISKQAFKS